jgi:hypothetical protein
MLQVQIVNIEISILRKGVQIAILEIDSTNNSFLLKSRFKNGKGGVVLTHHFFALFGDEEGKPWLILGRCF